MMEFKKIDNRCPKEIQTMQNEDNLFICRVSEECSDFLDYDELIRWGIKPIGILKLNGVLNPYEKMRSLYRIIRHRNVKPLDEYTTHNYKAQTVFNAISVVVDFDITVYKSAWKKLLKDTKIKRIYFMKGISYFWMFDRGFEPSSKVVLVDNYYNAVIDRALSYDYYIENSQGFEETLSWLNDDISKETEYNYLKGHIEMTPFPLKGLWEKEDVENQYFPDDLITLSDSEVFVDCGAYIGDTFEAFTKRVAEFKKYYALEPDPRRRQRIEKLQENSGGSLNYIPKGAWNCKTDICFSTNEGECGTINENDDSLDKISVDAIDNIIPEDEQVTFIKMDIEGAELCALEGARKTIERCKPKLAICVYHKREDLITIPQLIKQINPDYKLYLRAHYPYVSELVLYAIP